MSFEKELNCIIERYRSETELIVSEVFPDGGAQPCGPRLHRAALNQIGNGVSTFSRYAIWANTVRDNIREAIEEMKQGNVANAEHLLIRAANSLSAFSDIQELSESMSDI